jgi:hypothetical protein
VAAALSAIVLSADVPIDPPTCCKAQTKAHDEQGRQHGTDIAGSDGELGQQGHTDGVQQPSGPSGPAPATNATRFAAMTVLPGCRANSNVLRFVARRVNCPRRDPVIRSLVAGPGARQRAD